MSTCIPAAGVEKAPASYPQAGDNLWRIATLPGVEEVPLTRCRERSRSKREAHDRRHLGRRRTRFPSRGITGSRPAGRSCESEAPGGEPRASGLARWVRKRCANHASGQMGSSSLSGHAPATEGVRATQVGVTNLGASNRAGGSRRWRKPPKAPDWRKLGWPGLTAGARATGGRQIAVRASPGADRAGRATRKAALEGNLGGVERGSGDPGRARGSWRLQASAFDVRSLRRKLEGRARHRGQALWSGKNVVL